ncbi:AI-2E family transporter [Patescibacteria group bacterium]|nr:AI-2E family transporter [Patescibacteria group bacterium]
MPRKIEISHRTIVFTVAFLIFVWFLYFIRDIILVFFVALLIMAILNPWVSKLSKYKIPRAVSVLVVYFLLFGVTGVSLASIVPLLAEQTTSFVNTLPKFIDRLGIATVLSEQIVGQLLSQIGTLSGQVAKVTISVFSNVLGMVTILIFAFYLLLARDKLDDQLGYFFGDKKRKEVTRIIDLLEEKLGGWARGQLALMFAVGLATYIGLVLLGIPFALPLAIIAGLFEIVPYFGPVLSAIPAVLIGFGISALSGFATVALYFLVQQLENYILVPKIMEKSVGVNPVIILLALAIGFRLAGIVGIIISVPVVIMIQILSREHLLSK